MKRHVLNFMYRLCTTYLSFTFGKHLKMTKNLPLLKRLKEVSQND